MRLDRRHGALLGLTVVLALYLRHVTPAEVADLKPRPDALEYAEGARNLARGDGYWLEIAGEKYPPRYPPGFPLLLAAARPLVGTRAADGVRVVLALALAGIAAAWALAGRTGGPAAGLVAALLVAVSPLDVRWSMSLMSDVPAATVAALLGLWCLRAARRGGGRGELALLGAAAGLGACLRVASLAILAPVAIVACAPLRAGEPGAARLRRGAAVALGAALGLLPLALYDWGRFGSPLASGYGLWEGAAFGLRYLGHAPLGSAGLPNALFYPAELAGHGDLLPWPAAVLTLLGGVVAWRAGGGARQLVVFTLWFVAASLALLLPFFWQADRFLLPLLPFLAACAGQAVAPHAGRATRAAGVLLLVAALLLVALRPRAPLADDREVACLERIDARIAPGAALILRTNPFLFRDYLRGGGEDGARPERDRSWLPVGRDEHRKAIARLGIAPAPGSRDEGWIVDLIDAPFDPAVVARGLDTLLRGGRPLYYATANREFEVRFAGDLARLLHDDFALTRLVDEPLCHLFRIRAKDTGPGDAAAGAPSTRRGAPQ